MSYVAGLEVALIFYAPGIVVVITDPVSNFVQELGGEFILIKLEV